MNDKPATARKRKPGTGSPWNATPQPIITYVAYNRYAGSGKLRELARGRDKDQLKEAAIRHLKVLVGQIFRTSGLEEQNAMKFQTCTLDEWRDMCFEETEREAAEKRRIEEAEEEHRQSKKRKRTDLSQEAADEECEHEHEHEPEPVNARPKRFVIPISSEVRRRAARMHYDAIKQAFNRGLSLWWISDSLRHKLETYKPRRYIGPIAGDPGRTTVALHKQKWRPLQTRPDFDRCLNIMEHEDDHRQETA